jgi:hypothetical protein
MRDWCPRVAAVCLLGVSTPSVAFLWGTPVNVTGYYVYENGLAYLRTSNNQNPDNCPKGSVYLALDTGSPRFKELYATIVAAQAVGSTVSLNYQGCLDGYPRIASVAVPSIW